MNDMNKRTFLSLLLCVCSLSFLHAERVDMQQAGADIQGRKLNTALINSTIDRLNANGGGTLFFPAGTYLTGSIHMKSNITLELEAGATLKFSENFDDFLPYVEVRHEGIMMKSFQPLIYAVDAENITIKGEGTLDGQGKAWWTEFFRVLVDLRDNGKRNINKYQPMFEKENDLKALYAETNEDWHGTLDRRFFRPPFMHPIRCKNVHISDCHISVGDDCITIKSGRDLQARKLGVPCENITITNCTMLSGHGGVVIGSEMSGGVKKVTISNCVFDGTDRGIRLKSTRGRGGIVEDIRVSNIVMSNIKKEAIVLNLKYSKMPAEPKSDRTPEFRNIYVSGVTVRDVNTPIMVVGLPEAPITGIVMRDVYIQNAKQRCVFEDCKDLVLDDVYVDGKEIK